jgi:hypothetical protein
MIDYRRRLSSCDLSSVPEIRDVSQLLKSGGWEEAARSPEHLLTLFPRLNLLKATLSHSQAKEYTKLLLQSLVLVLYL